MENYAIKERSQEELKYLERIKALRKIELFSQKTSRELTTELMRKENVHELVSAFACILFVAYQIQNPNKKHNFLRYEFWFL